MVFAFQNDQSVKERYLALVQAHAHIDEMAAYGERIGIPRQIIYLQDHLAQKMSHAEALAILESIPVGADLSLVMPRFMMGVLDDSVHSSWSHWLRFGESDKKGIESVVMLYQRLINGGTVSKDEWDAKRAGRGVLGGRILGIADDALGHRGTAVSLCDRAAAYACAAEASSAAAAVEDAREGYAAAVACVAEAYAALMSYDPIYLDDGLPPLTAGERAAIASRAQSSRTGYYRWMRDKLLELVRTAPLPAAD